jgi:alkylated DNA repair dioxygenase AlkB
MRIENFFSPNKSQALFDQLLAETSWEQKEIKMHGKLIKIPRLTAWHGTASYTYSGIKNKPLPWTQCLAEIKAAIEDHTWLNFSHCLLNLYRDGQDSISWHSDDEPELGPNPIIASLSLGATRKFQTKEKATGKITNYELKAGDLLIMPPGFQTTHLHQIPKTTKAIGARINLTFR